VCVLFSLLPSFGVLAIFVSNEVLEWFAKTVNQRDHGGTLVPVAAAFASDFGPRILPPF
jgi:hypothetical protein